jgi:hypothetical protein
LGTFTSLAFNTCNNIALAVIAHTASKPISKRHLMHNTTEIGLDRWQSLDRETWSLIVASLEGRSAIPKPRMPRPHQSAAVAAAQTGVHGRLATGQTKLAHQTGLIVPNQLAAVALEEADCSCLEGVNDSLGAMYKRSARWAAASGVLPVPPTRRSLFPFKAV